jgi:Caspase domain
MRLVVVLIASLFAATAAHAETHRLAIVLGNNAGTGENPALHYAELDATKLSQTLVELGGVEPADLHLLHGRTLGELQAVFTRAAARIAAWRTVAGARVVLLFYFSGHSDGEALELGADRLGFAQLRSWLAATGADVRVVIIDSCKSGAMLAVKGGRPGTGFQIRLSDSVSSNGEALLTSSAADEIALESKEIRGSFFTHHLVSGLRGAADLSGDGNVTLGEAYQYAFARTVSATSATTFGPQHPAYDYRLTGEGEVVLASSARPSARLTLPDGFDRVLIVHLTRDQVLAELPRGAMRTLAVPPATYAVRGWRQGVAYEGRVAVRAGEARTVRAEELVVTALGAAGTKGSFARAETATLAVASGWQRGVASDVGLLAISASLRAPGARGWSATLDVSSGRGDGYRETEAAVLAGYFIGHVRGRLRGDLGLHVGGGMVTQHVDGGGRFTGPMFVVAPWLGVATDLTSRLSLRAEARLSTIWLKRDDAGALDWLPAGYLGVALRL